MAENNGIGNIGPGGLIDLLLAQAPVAIALFDQDMRYIACNDRWTMDYQLAGREIVGKSHLEFFPDVGEKWRKLHARAMAGQRLSLDLDTPDRGDGRVAWARCSGAPWQGADGAIAGVLMRSEALTPQIEKALGEQVMGEELSLFFHVADNFAICMLDDSGKVAIWNSGTEKLLGWSESEALGREFSFIFDAADRQRQLPSAQLEIARREGVFRDRSWRVRKNGSRLLAEVTISRIEGDGPLAGGFGQIMRDITSEDTQAKSLEASTVLLRSILETVPDAMIIIDEHGKVLSFSKAAETLFGYDSGEIIGQNVSILMPFPDRERHDDYLARYRETGVRRIIGSSRRVIGRRKDGSTFPHDLRVGEAIGGGQRVFAGFVRDLSEQEDAQSRLRELQRELNHIARVSEMGTLATVMAHELNQPLMAIGNMVQTSSDLLRTDGTAANLALIRQALDDAGAEAMRAGAILRRLRSFVSRGEIERSIEDPRSLVEDALALIWSDAKVRNIQCPVMVAEDVGQILVDRVHIQQVVLNLLINAKDSIGRDGEIRISVRAIGNMAEFRISDSGPGVPPDRISRLFEPFSTTKHNGMGLGLSICRTIVEAHGGKIWYEGSGTPGAAFLFTLPQYGREEIDDR